MCDPSAHEDDGEGDRLITGSSRRRFSEMSIRYKIFGAFSVVIMLACGLALYGIRGISDSGDLVVRLYDGPLMGINHARSAHAALNEAQLLMYRSLVEGSSKEAVTKFEKLVRNVNEDI